MEQRFVGHSETTVTIIAKLLDLWSLTYENGVEKDFGHFVAADIITVAKSGNLVE